MAVYEFNMASLKELMRKQSEQNPNASYFNIDILKYQVKARQGASSCPLQMVAYWKCADDNTDLRLDYKYNAHAMAEPSALLNLSIAVPIDGGVKNMQSKPNGKWQENSLIHETVDPGLFVLLFPGSPRATAPSGTFRPFRRQLTTAWVPSGLVLN